jgi:hypothetical protein
LLYSWPHSQITRFTNNDGFAIGYHYCDNIMDGFGMA